MMRFSRKGLLLLLVLVSVVELRAQLMNHYWSQSYNSISSLLSGAVVAGDAGPSSIYYNPATIRELTTGTNVSLAASFLTLNHYSYLDAVGEGKDLSTTNFYVQPQFFSMSFNPPIKKLSIEIASFTRIRERMSLNYTGLDFRELQGDNAMVEYRYSSSYDYKNDYDDSWLGAGVAYEMSDRLSFGASLFFSFSTLKYFHGLSAVLHPTPDSTGYIPAGEGYLIAENTYTELVKFTNIRMTSKLGASYKLDSWSFGLNLTFPAINLFSTGNRAERYQKELYDVVEGEADLQSYLIYDEKEGNDLKTNFKLPFSIAAGINYQMPDEYHRFYLTLEFFAGVKPYKMVDAPYNDQITSGPILDDLETPYWLSFAYGAKPLLNVAIGYQTKIKEKLMFLMGLRTDFNNFKNYDLGGLSTYNSIYTAAYDIYHATGGIQFHYKRHLLVAGTQLSYGYAGKQKQIANFEFPTEIVDAGNLPLFGQPEDVMNVHYFSISLFIGATFNFIKEEKLPDE